MKLFLYLLTASWLLGCQTENQKKSETLQEETPESLTELCFRNEYAFPNDSTRKDVLELFVKVDDSIVTGELNWLPAEKDRRKGRIDGKIENNKVLANYVYTQEGKIDTSLIVITIQEQQALLSAKNAHLQLGLPDTIKRVSCE